MADETKPRNRKSLAGKASTSETLTVVAAGQTLGSRYKLKREVARGGMGIVFEAIDTTLNDHRVAIKVLPPEMAKNEAAILRLKDEALAAIKVTHANIMRLHSFEQDGTDCFLVMEYLDGDNLELELAKRKKIPLEEVIDLAGQAAAALDTAHEHNLVHRDIKPANMMFTTVNDKRVLKITDFGIAYEIKDSMTRLTGTEASLTPQYASPEQLQAKRLDGRTDQYSLAVTLYELLDGRPPFGGAGLTHQIINAKPEPVEGISEEANAALLKALSKDPKERFADCSTFVRALRGEVPVVAQIKAEGKTERSPLASTLIGIVVLFLLYGTYKMPVWFAKKPPAPLPTTNIVVTQGPPLLPATPTPTPPPVVTKREEVVPPTGWPTPASYSPPATKEVVTPVPVVKTETVITTNPKGAKVFCKEANLATGKIDEEFRADFSPGTYTFVGVMAGYRRLEEKHVVPNEGPFHLHFELAKKEATLILENLFLEAQVRIDDRPVGPDEWSNLLLSPGRHRIFVEGPGKIPFDVTVVLKDEEVKRLPVHLKEEEAVPPPIKTTNIAECFEYMCQSIYKKQEAMFEKLWVKESRPKGLEIYKQAVMNGFTLKPEDMRERDGKAIIYVMAIKDGKALDGIFLYLEEGEEGWRFINWDENEQRAKEFVPPEEPNVDQGPFREAFDTFARAIGERNHVLAQSVCDDVYWRDYGGRFFEMLIKATSEGSDFVNEGGVVRNGRAVINGHFKLDGRPVTIYMRFEERPDGVKLINVVDSENTNGRWLDTGR